MKTTEEIRELVLDLGNRTILVANANPKGKPIDTSITLHELIAYIHDTGNATGRHLSGGELKAISDGDDPRELT